MGIWEDTRRAEQTAANRRVVILLPIIQQFLPTFAITRSNIPSDKKVVVAV
jgi:hypothetical protein